MPDTRPYAILSTSTWLIGAGVLGAMSMKLYGAWVLFIMLWEVLIISDLHCALPDDFFETENRAFLYIGLSVALKVGASVALSLFWFIEWALWPFDSMTVMAGVAVVFVIGFIVAVQLRLWIARHILSAVITLEEGEASRAGELEIFLCLLFPPYLIVASHARARKVLFGPQADSWDG